jgi:hypothetical protein
MTAILMYYLRPQDPGDSQGKRAIFLCRGDVPLKTTYRVLSLSLLTLSIVLSFHVKTSNRVGPQK